MSPRPPVFLVKWGGSLITDKAGNEAVRREVVDRLAVELAGASARFVLGHGSGSFGHRAALESGWDGRSRPQQISAVSRTQDAAARLHRVVVAALLEAGLEPFSLAPGSFMTGPAAGGAGAVTVAAALDAGHLPVLYGDVALTEEGEPRIVSTETVLRSLLPGLLARGHGVAGAIWLGRSEGILDGAGAPVDRVTAANLDAVRAAAVGSAGDVTGGMRLRLETALELSRFGVPSWIGNGDRAGALAAAVAALEASGCAEPEEAARVAATAGAEAGATRVPAGLDSTRSRDGRDG